MPADQSTAATPTESAAQAAAEITAEPLAKARRCLEDLDRALNASWARTGGANTLDARRVRADLAHLRESLDLLRASTASGTQATPGGDLVEIPDTPYDPAMWNDADDEGIGCRH